MVVSCELNGYIWVITRSIDLKKGRYLCFVTDCCMGQNESQSQLKTNKSRISVALISRGFQFSPLHKKDNLILLSLKKRLSLF